MKRKIISSILAMIMAGGLVTGCTGTGTVGNTASPAAETAEASEASMSAEEAEATGETPETEDGYDEPEDFVQEQSGKKEFADYDDVINNLKDGQGYALIKVYGYDGDVLAVSDSVFLADHSAADAAFYAMYNGKPKSLGIIAGNGSAFPLRIGDGIIYAGDNHNYESYFMGNAGGIPGIMAKDVVSDGIDGDGSFSGFLREDNNYDNDKDFTGGQAEFDALMAEKESKPVIEFTIVGDEGSEGEGESSVTSPFEKALEIYKNELKGASKDDYYAFADLDDEYDVLLIAGKDDIFTDDEGNVFSTDATIYGPDKDGNIIEYGHVGSGTTALPLSAMDKKLYYGNHTELYTSALNREKGTLDNTTSEDFGPVDDENMVQLYFFKVSDLEDTAAGSSSALPAYEYKGSDGLYKEAGDYIVKEFGSHFEKADVCVPVILKVAVDDSNEDDTVLYGDFWVQNFNQKGDILESASGGSFPGAIHFKKTGDGYEATKADICEDGSSFDSSAKKIFGDNYDDFMKVYSDDKAFSAELKKILADYVKDNDLDIRAYQDYGWDPVDLK